MNSSYLLIETNNFSYSTNRLDENEIEGEEDGISRIDDDEVKFTPFNMKEELEEGHFDADGHYQWKKDKEIKDNWLDNIDWVKVRVETNLKNDSNFIALFRSKKIPTIRKNTTLRGYHFLTQNHPPMMKRWLKRRHLTSPKPTKIFWK